jgi:hypothetical protein
MQVGGGISAGNAREWIEAGASKVCSGVCLGVAGGLDSRSPNASRIKIQIRLTFLFCFVHERPTDLHAQVIVTSALFPGGTFAEDVLRDMCAAVGRERLVVDIRWVLCECEREGGWGNAK